MEDAKEDALQHLLDPGLDSEPEERAVLMPLGLRLTKDEQEMRLLLQMVGHSRLAWPSSRPEKKMRCDLPRWLRLLV